MRVEKLERWHLERLRERGVENVALILSRESYLAELSINGFAGLIGEGVVAAMGLCEQNAGNFRCWAFTDPELASRHFVSVCKLVRTYLVEFKAPRIETVVYMGNIKGHRWVTEILGFEAEGIMRNWGEGRDAMLYSRIN